jgi:hypothetical protein
METNQILPVLDMEVLKQKANEAAMAGAIKSIDDYYNSYNSPFRNLIDAELEKTEIGSGIQLPDIIAIINNSLSKEIDLIANTAISKTFLPLVQKFLTREEKEIKFSDFLKEFIRCMDDGTQDDYRVEVEKHRTYDWLEVNISFGDRGYDLTFHEEWVSKKEGNLKYQILSLPRDDSKYKPTMTLKIDNASLEMPFTRDILKDDFMSYVARLVIANTFITMDCSDFDSDMFPNENE